MSELEDLSKEQFEDLLDEIAPDGLSYVPHDIREKDYPELNLGQMTPQDLDKLSDYGTSSVSPSNDVFGPVTASSPYSYSPNNLFGGSQNNTGSLHPNSAIWPGRTSSSIRTESRSSSRSRSSDYRMEPYTIAKSQRSSRAASPSRSEFISSDQEEILYDTSDIEDEEMKKIFNGKPRRRKKISKPKAPQPKSIAPTNRVLMPKAVPETPSVEKLPSTAITTPGFRIALTLSEIADLETISSMIPPVRKAQYKGQKVYDSCLTEKAKTELYRTWTYFMDLKRYNSTVPIPWPIKTRHFDSPETLHNGLDAVRTHVLSTQGYKAIPEETSASVRHILDASERLNNIQNTIVNLFKGPLSTLNDENHLRNQDKRSLFVYTNTYGYSLFPQDQLIEAVHTLKDVREKNELPKDPQILERLYEILKHPRTSRSSYFLGRDRNFGPVELVESLEWLRKEQMAGGPDSLLNRKSVTYDEQ